MAENDEGSPSVLFSVDWETFVCSGQDARTCYEHLCDGYIQRVLYSFFFFFRLFYIHFYICFLFVLQPSSCLSDREEDEIYGLTTAERRFPPAAATVRPPVHLTTAIRQHTVQQPWVYDVLCTLNADYYYYFHITITVLVIIIIVVVVAYLNSICFNVMSFVLRIIKDFVTVHVQVYVWTASPTISLLKSMQIESIRALVVGCYYYSL